MSSILVPALRRKRNEIEVIINEVFARSDFNTRSISKVLEYLEYYLEFYFKASLKSPDIQILSGDVLYLSFISRIKGDEGAAQVKIYVDSDEGMTAYSVKGT